jgi:hypothetical protein
VDLDPLEHGLLFERFMAPGRIDLPDIDCDFESRRRGEILAYLRDAYGADKTAQIATVNEMKGKDCINSVGRVLEIPIGKLRAVSATIEARKKGDADVHATIVDAFQENQVCKDFDTEYPQFLPLATKLEGTAKVLGVHAAGVVVTPIPVMDICPLETREGDEGPVVVTAVDMNGAAELGLVKIDVLAVKNVDMVEDCVRMVRERHGTEIDFAEIDYNDPAVIQKFTAGLFAGIFQFDTASAQKLCNGVQFERFEDITALNALNRPGTMQSGLAAEWIKRKADPEARVSIHPVVDEACADTLGVIAYQEHVMRILRAVGFTPEETDALRKKISKSFGRETLAKEAERFVEMATARGWDRELAEKVIDQISAFGGYGFNKSHAASYATTSYRQMWLKTYYPVEYMWSLLTNEDQMSEDGAPGEGGAQDGHRCPPAAGERRGHEVGHHRSRRDRRRVVGPEGHRPGRHRGDQSASSVQALRRLRQAGGAAQGEQEGRRGPAEGRRDGRAGAESEVGAGEPGAPVGPGRRWKVDASWRRRWSRSPTSRTGRRRKPRRTRWPSTRWRRKGPSSSTASSWSRSRSSGRAPRTRGSGTARTRSWSAPSWR